MKDYVNYFNYYVVGEMELLRVLLDIAKNAPEGRQTNCLRR
jgi:hypothetical protein